MKEEETTKTLFEKWSKGLFAVSVEFCYLLDVGCGSGWASRMILLSFRKIATSLSHDNNPASFSSPFFRVFHRFLTSLGAAQISEFVSVYFLFPNNVRV